MMARKTRNLIWIGFVEVAMRFIKRVVNKGHVTVPADLRSALVIESGDIVEFEVLAIRRRARTLPVRAPGATTARGEAA